MGLASGVDTTFVLELEVTQKATHRHLSDVDREYSQNILCAKEMGASFAMRANSNPPESSCSIVTHVLLNFGWIELLSACGTRHTLSNRDMSCDVSGLVSGKQIKKGR